MTELLTAFSEVAAWMWEEVGLLLAFLLVLPLLLLAMSIFFIGRLLAFFMQIYHSG